MNQPLVSVVMTTYNGEQYLEAQLESLIAQSYKNIEIIICDDFSTDGTKDVIKEFAAADKRISYFFNEVNLGVNKNFEQGFLKAKGDFIAISDQDDIWLPEKIEHQMSLFSPEEIQLVHSISVRFSGEKLPTEKKTSAIHLFEGSDVRRLLLRNSVSGHNIIFKKKLLAQILPLPKEVYYDWWIVQTAACNGKVVGTYKVLAYQRSHGSNVTVKKRTGGDQTEAEYKERKNALQAFIHLQGLKEVDREFIELLSMKFSQLKNCSYSLELYSFLMQNREIFFFYKKGILKYFSQRKAAIRMSKKVINEILSPE